MGSPRRFEFPILQRNWKLRVESPRPFVPNRAFNEVSGFPSAAFSGFAGDVPSRRFEGCTLRRDRRNALAFIRHRRRPSSQVSLEACIFRRQLMSPQGHPCLVILRLRQRESPGRPESSFASGFFDCPRISFALTLWRLEGVDLQILGSPRFSAGRQFAVAWSSFLASASAMGR